MGTLMVEINPYLQDLRIPAMVVFSILSGALFSLPIPLVEAREAGIIRSFFVNGVPIRSVIAIPSLTFVVHVSIVSAIIIVSAPLLFSAPMPINWLAFLLVMLASIFTLSGLGILIGIASKNTRTTVLWSQLIFLPSMMLSGMMVPLDVIPQHLTIISRALPTSLFGSSVWWSKLCWVASLVVLLLGGIRAFVLARFLYCWDDKNRQHTTLFALLAALPYLVESLLLA